MTIGKYIRELRVQKGITQEELAEKTMLSVRTIQRIEKGEVDPRAYTLQIIAEALEVEFEVLNKSCRPNAHINSSEEEKTWLPLLHFSGLFLLFFPPFIIWISKKDHNENLNKHGIDVINFQLSMLTILIPSSILAVLLITIPVIIFIGIFSTIVILINTVKVLNNQSYKYPMTIRYLK